MLAWFRVWRLKGRWVRVHIEGSGPSLEGIYRGCRGGHRILDVPQLVTGGREPSRITGFVAVPVARVLFMEVKA